MQKKIKILIVDDNPADASLLKRHLSRIQDFNLIIELCHSGNDAIQQNLTFKADLIFVDYLLGAETGIQVIENIKKNRMNAEFVLLTGFGSESVVTEALRAGASDYLNKDEQTFDSIYRTVRHLYEKKEAEEKVRQAENRLQNILEKTETGIMIFSDDAILKDANNAFFKYLELPQPLQILNKPVKELLHKHSYNSLEEAFVKLQNSEKNIEINLDFKSGKDNKIISLLICLFTEVIDNERNIIGVCRNITEQIQTSLLLKESEESLRQAQQIAKLGNWEIDIENANEKASNEFYRIFGITKDKNQNFTKQIAQILHSEDKVNFENFFSKLKKNGAVEALEICLTLPNEPDRYIKIEGGFVVKQNAQKLIGIAQDITQQKNNENILCSAKIRAEESDRLKSAFLSNLSHEIRTPMNAIIGFANLIAIEADENLRNDYVEKINHSGEMLLHLIDSIIEISKLQAGQLVLQEKEFEINKLMTDLLNLANKEKLRMAKSHINIQFNPTLEHEYIYIQSDVTRIKQIIYNLLHNALKFTEHGSVEFGFSIVDIQNEIIIYVKDTGIGITTDDIDKIFNRFWRGSDSYNEIFRGTGIGLTIARELTEMLGGKIWVQSTLGAGSTFFISLPYTLSNNKLNIKSLKQ